MVNFICLLILIATAIWLIADFGYFFIRDYYYYRSRNLTMKQALLVAWRNV